MAILKLHTKTSFGTAIFSAASLKLCCWGPLFLTGVAGISGSSVYFSWLILLKPYLLTIAFLSLAVAFYQVYKPKKEAYNCSENCETDKNSFLKSKLYLWIVTVFVILMTLISYFPQMFYQTIEKEVIVVDKSAIQTVKLTVEGMTCTGCEENINRSVHQLDGIIETKTSHKTGISEIKFDTSKTNIAKIEEAIRSKGYVLKINGNE